MGEDEDAASGEAVDDLTDDRGEDGGETESDEDEGGRAVGEVGGGPRREEASKAGVAPDRGQGPVGVRGASRRLDQCVTPSFFGGGRNVASTIFRSSTVFGRPERSASDNPARPLRAYRCRHCRTVGSVDLTGVPRSLSERMRGPTGAVDTRAIAVLLARGYRDLGVAGATPTYPTAIGDECSAEPRLRLDHVFATPAVAARCTGFRVLAEEPAPAASDHVPVVAESDVSLTAVAQVRRGSHGAVNVAAPAGRQTYDVMLRRCAEMAGGRPELVRVDPEVLARAGVRPWMELPLWSGDPAPWNANVRRATAAGLCSRPLDATVADTWRELSTGPLGSSSGGCGMDPAREAALIQRVRERPKSG